STFPTEGSLIQLSVSQDGAFGGDYTFTKLGLTYRKYWTVGEDYLNRKSVVTLRSDIGYIVQPDVSPFFERFYAGGRNFRGFEYRGVGPRGVTRLGVPTTEAVGGDWMFLMGVEYNAPIYQDYVRYVVFMDTGTVQQRFGFDQYRVAIGAGVRIKI